MQSCVNFNTAFDYLLMSTIFHVQKVLIILDWCLCDFLLLKHINEVHALHLDLSFTNVDIFFLSAKCSYHSQLMFMWFSCTKTYWWSGCTSYSFVIYCFWLFTDVDYFSCENVFIILNWCLCDFLLLLLLKHIDEVDGLHSHLSLT